MNGSIGEKFTFTFNVSLVSMIIVFAILVLLMVVIMLQSRILKVKKQEPVIEHKNEMPIKKSEEAVKVIDINKDYEVVAAIMAALSAHLGKPIEGLQIKSIKRLNNGNSNWQKSSIENKLNN